MYSLTGCPERRRLRVGDARRAPAKRTTRHRTARNVRDITKQLIPRQGGWAGLDSDSRRHKRTCSARACRRLSARCKTPSCQSGPSIGQPPTACLHVRWCSLVSGGARGGPLGRPRVALGRSPPELSSHLRQVSKCTLSQDARNAAGYALVMPAGHPPPRRPRRPSSLGLSPMRLLLRSPLVDPHVLAA